MRGWMVKMATIGGLVGALLAMVGCDAQRIEKLEEGVSTEADVRKQFGTPHAVATQADGSKIIEYTRQPEGGTNYRITIGADGKMSALKQLLTPANVARVQPGMTKLDVLDLLGQVAKSQAYELKGEEDWNWRFFDNKEPRWLTVTFNREGQVLRSQIGDDPRGTAGTK